MPTHPLTHSLTLITYSLATYSEANWAAASFVLTPEALAKIDEIHCRHRNPNLQD